jgi:enterochelin esterase-like enzyme
MGIPGAVSLHSASCRRHGSLRRRVLTTGGLALLLVAVMSSFGLAPVSAGAHAGSVASPEVVHTRTGPTGYEVTFRIHDPSATRMRIKGEWSFSSAADIAAAPLKPTPRLPSQWQPGDFPLGSPNSPAPNWPVADMVKNKATGVWSYTTPLPSGVFNYQLYRDCDAAVPELSGCVASSDPANPPWNNRGSVQLTSQVYVPSDKRFGTVDYSWQAPTPARQRGTLQSVSYPSPLSTNPVGSHDLVVYTPPGYDPNRATPYPLFVLSHGGGGNEVDWSTQGVMGPIVDNLIAAGRMQPAIIAMTNFGGLAGDEPGYDSDVRNAVIPFLEKNYNITGSASGRALAGLSGGATRVNEVLFNNAAAFGYVAVWSAPRGLPAEGDPAFTNPDLKKLLGLHIGVGVQDVGGLAGQNTHTEQLRLAAAGIPFVAFNIDGGHTWDYWRQALRNFLTRVAFRTTATTLHATPTPAGVVLRAVVTPATEEPASPTGKVQFTVDGSAYGAPRPLHNGVAELTIPASGMSSTTASYGATYGGDRYYTASTATSS